MTQLWGYSCDRCMSGRIRLILGGGHDKSKQIRSGKRMWLCYQDCRARPSVRGNARFWLEIPLFVLFCTKCGPTFIAYYITLGLIYHLTLGMYGKFLLTETIEDDIRRFVLHYCFLYVCRYMIFQICVNFVFLYMYWLLQTNSYFCRTDGST
jgi:hypothetical protein